MLKAIEFKVTATESRLNAIIEVKNDLLGRLEEVI